MSNQPTITPFTYVFIPSDDTKEVEERRFEGTDDTELRKTITRYFRQQLLSADQERDMAKHLMVKADEAAKKNAVGDGDDDNKPANSDQQKAIIQSYLDNTSFEIIPVEMPIRQTKFIGTSLYIDDSGAFKGLPINLRASKIAQRDIRGDAFLLSNRDDPALDEWARVDCTKETFLNFYEHPPKTNYDTSNSAQMQKMALLRDADTKKIAEEDVKKAFTAKMDGNAFFSQKDYKAAVQAYSMVVDLTEGRRDLLPNEAEVTSLRVASLLNRSLCSYYLGQGDAAARDARTAIHLDSDNIKGYYRLVQAQILQREYEQAERTLNEFKNKGGDETSFVTLQNEVQAGKKQFKNEEKKKFGKLFS